MKIKIIKKMINQTVYKEEKRNKPRNKLKNLSKSKIITTR